MRFDVPTVLLKCDQMRNLVNQGDQKTVLIQIGIYRNLVLSIDRFPIITMPRLPLMDNFQMHTMGFDQLKTRPYSMLGEVFGEDFQRKNYELWMMN